MKGIDKNKHSQLLRGLHELLAITSDPDDARRVEAEIDALSAGYERYRNLIAESLLCAATYNSRHGSIRSMLSRELRRARRTANADTHPDVTTIRQTVPVAAMKVAAYPATRRTSTPALLTANTSIPTRNRA